MKTTDDYLKMQREQYNTKGSTWSLNKKDHFPVGMYEEHNNWEDYDTCLFQSLTPLDTVSLTALEYGCGPGRNIVKFNNRFSTINGVDISSVLIEKAKLHVKEYGINSTLLSCDGKSIPFSSNSHDVVFSVICLQHIAVFEIRDSIIKEVHRVLKDGGYFCFQMGMGGSNKNRKTVDYYDNEYSATGSNGICDVTVRDYREVEKHLLDNNFRNFKYQIRQTGPKCHHRNWIWVEVQK